METIANLLQESSTGHSAAVGFSGDGLAASPEMLRLRLIWIIAKMHIDMDEYPEWGDVVEIETWLQLDSTIAARREWVLRLPDRDGRVIGRATSVLMMMNQDSRKVSRIPPSIRAELEPLMPPEPKYAVAPGDVPKVPKMELEQPQEQAQEPGGADSQEPPKTPETASLHGALPADTHCLQNLTARRADLDMNQHVNNVTYLSWMLEAIPQAVMERAELAQITVEYRRECHRGDLVQSLVQPAASLAPPAAVALPEAAANQLTTSSNSRCCTEQEQHSKLQNKVIGACRAPAEGQNFCLRQQDMTLQMQIAKGMEAEDPVPPLLPHFLPQLMGAEVLAAQAALIAQERPVVTQSFNHMLRLQEPGVESAQWKEVLKGQTVWRLR